MAPTLCKPWKAVGIRFRIAASGLSLPHRLSQAFGLVYKHRGLSRANRSWASTKPRTGGRTKGTGNTNNASNLRSPTGQNTKGHGKHPKPSLLHRHGTTACAPPGSRSITPPRATFYRMQPVAAPQTRGEIGRRKRWNRHSTGATCLGQGTPGNGTTSGGNCRKGGK